MTRDEADRRLAEIARICRLESDRLSALHDDYALLYATVQALREALVCSDAWDV